MCGDWQCAGEPVFMFELALRGNADGLSEQDKRPGLSIYLGKRIVIFGVK